MKNKLTIFTPTYNRMQELSILYESLEKQTCKCFVWLIVDDGSTDETGNEVLEWEKKASFEIKYIWQKNKGKSYAHNIGVRNTTTELFTCVDSDDYLTKNAVERICSFWEKRNAKDVGILARRKVTKIKKHSTYYDNIHTTLRDASRKYGIFGDTMLIYKTDIIKKYHFPYFKNEKFVPENYLYDLLDKEGSLYFLNEVLYLGDYQADGYTYNMASVLKSNPKGYIAYIVQRIDFDLKLNDIICDLIRYIAMCIAVHKKGFIRKSKYPIITCMLIPFGLLFYFVRYYKV